MIRTLRNIARCLTFRRILNLVKLLASYKLSAWSGRSVVWGLPWTLTIEPTNRCNLECPECPSGLGALTRPLGAMREEDFRRLVDEVAPHAFYLQLFFQGEPFMNKELIGMIRYAHAKRMYVSVSTNAHFIRNGTARAILSSGLDRLIVSLDGLTEETYRAYRIGGSLAAVTGALNAIAAERAAAEPSRMELVLQFLVNRRNEAELPRLKSFARAFRARVAIKTMQISTPGNAQRFLPAGERYRRYRMADGALVPKSGMKNRCAQLWERSVVTWDGTVVPCCFDKDAAHPLGSLRGRSFRDIWRSGAYHAFRSRILRNRKGVPMCTNCTEGLKIYRHK